LEVGDILFARRGIQATGLSAIVGQPQAGWICGTGAILLRVTGKNIDPGFLSFLLSSEESIVWLKQHAVGAVMPNLNEGIIRRLPLTIPPLPTQKSIAHVLGTLDDLIELNRETNEILEEMARALFQSWFIDFDPVRWNMEQKQPSPRPSPTGRGSKAAGSAPLPSPGGRRAGDEGRFALDAATAALFPEHFQDSELGQIPKGWEVGKVGDSCSNSRIAVQPGDIASDTAYIALEHMPRRCIALGEWGTSESIASGKSAFKKGEILFGKLRPYFHKVGVAPVDGVCSTDILVLKPKAPQWFGFVLGHASSDALVQFADQASAGTKMPRTNWNDIAGFRIAIPPLQVAAAFTRIIEPMIHTIVENLQRIPRPRHPARHPAAEAAERGSERGGS
jgi:type I restriction enzyme S subunit